MLLFPMETIFNDHMTYQKQHVPLQTGLFKHLSLYCFCKRKKQQQHQQNKNNNKIGHDDDNNNNKNKPSSSILKTIVQNVRID